MTYLKSLAAGALIVASTNVFAAEVTPLTWLTGDFLETLDRDEVDVLLRTLEYAPQLPVSLTNPAKTRTLTDAEAGAAQTLIIDHLRARFATLTTYETYLEAKAYENIGNYAQAITCYTQLLERSGGAAHSLLFERARARQATGDYLGAAADLERSLAERNLPLASATKVRTEAIRVYLAVHANTGDAKWLSAARDEVGKYSEADLAALHESGSAPFLTSGGAILSLGVKQ